MNLLCIFYHSVLVYCIFIYGLWPENKVLLLLLYYRNEIFMSIAMFGGLHIGLAALKTAENIRESSGWTGELVQVGVATSG